MQNGRLIQEQPGLGVGWPLDSRGQPAPFVLPDGTKVPIGGGGGNFIDPRDFGAKFDGVADDTAALQAAIDAATLSGGVLQLPPGVANISAALTIGYAQGWSIVGSGRSRTTIRQQAANTPIIRLMREDTHSWRMRGFGLVHAIKQAGGGAAPNAVAVLFDQPNTGSIYNFAVEDVFVDKAYRGFALNPLRTGVSAWGATFRDCLFGSDMTGAAVRFQGATTVGQPNINFDNVYVRPDSATEPSIQIVAGNGVNLRGVEFNYGTYDQFTQMELTSCTAVSLINCRSEAAVVTQAGAKTLWSLPDTEAVIIGCEVGGATCSGGGVLRFISAGSSGKLSVLGMHCSGGRADGGQLLAYYADKLDLVANVKLADGWTKNPRPILGDIEMPSLDVDLLTADATQTRGDANVTLVAADYRHQYFNQTLTANRTITLPNAGLVDGMEFHITRYASTPGAFTLTTFDPINGRSYVIASGTKGFVRWRAVGSNEWLPIEAGTLP